jgi:hypothetical protein
MGDELARIDHPDIFDVREQARLRAKEIVASNPGIRGRKKRRPAYEVAAAKAAIKANKIADELIRQALNVGEDGEPGTGDLTATQQQKAIEILFAAEQRVRQEKRESEDHLNKLSGGELTRELLETLRGVTGIENLYDFEGTAEEIGEIEDEEGGEDGIDEAAVGANGYETDD